jgi:hypothetical protein
MSKKSFTRLSGKVSTLRGPKRTRYLAVAALSLIVTLSLGTVLGPWRNSFGSRKLRALIASPLPAPAIPAPGNPSKEYIYAGGKLIATEEPASGGSLAPPASLVATTSSGSQIDITWASVANVHHYEIEKALNLPSFTPLSSNVTTTSFTDTTVTNGIAYLYRVRAVDAFGNVSPYSNLDVATAIAFTDNPLMADSTVVKAQHVAELRQAVNAVRTTANLPAAIWTDTALSGVTVKAVHVQELRMNLDQALSALGLTVSPYTDSALSGVGIKKVHIDELRQRVK